MPSIASPSIPFALLTLALAGCAGHDEASADSDAVPAQASSGPASSATPKAPTDGEDGSYGARTTTSVPSFQVQEGWVEESPSSSMRVAQYRLPAQGDDAEDAQLAVFHFPSSGTVEQNFQRWAGQLAQPDGGDPMEAAVRSEREVRGMTVHQIDCSGRFVAETFPGSGVRVDKPGWRLLGAVVESARGPYYVKLTGPDATVAHWRASYEAFLSAM